MAKFRSIINMKLKNINNDIIIGTAQLGTKYGITNKHINFDKNKRLLFLDYIYNKGYKTFDTAYAYKNAHKILGNWIKKRDIQPKIYTKIANLQKYSFKNIKQIYEDSIKILNIKTIKGLLLHNHLDWKQDSVKHFISESLEKSIIKKFGFSIYDVKDIPIDPLVNIIQVPGNIFNQTILDSNELNKFRNKGGIVQIRSIFIQGLLLMDIKDISLDFEELRKPLYCFHNYAKELNTNSFILAILCVKKKFPEAKLVLGFDNIKQFSALNNIEKHKISDSDLNEVIKYGKKNNNKLWDPRNWK